MPRKFLELAGKGEVAVEADHPSLAARGEISGVAGGVAGRGFALATPRVWRRNTNAESGIRIRRSPFLSFGAS